MAQREAFAAFGNGELYIEKYITGIKHIEIQILADSKGNVIHLGERDCSIQRRHQKLLEESPSPSITEKQRKYIGELAVRAAKALKYRNAGTFEFILDQEGNVYFIEINTRIQVEHPVTEMITGIDLIKEQIKLAAGYPLEYRQLDIKMKGHAIECRINAEDPERFIPSPGRIDFLNLAGGPGVRIDTAIYPGYTVPPYYDSMIAKLIVWAPTRHEAILRMQQALNEMDITGIKTTIPLHKKILQNPAFIKGEYNTFLIDEMNNTMIRKTDVEIVEDTQLT